MDRFGRTPLGWNADFATVGIDLAALQAHRAATKSNSWRGAGGFFHGSIWRDPTMPVRLVSWKIYPTGPRVRDSLFFGGK